MAIQCTAEPRSTTACKVPIGTQVRSCTYIRSFGAGIIYNGGPRKLHLYGNCCKPVVLNQCERAGDNFPRISTNSCRLQVSQVSRRWDVPNCVVDMTTTTITLLLAQSRGVFMMSWLVVRHIVLWKDCAGFVAFVVRTSYEDDADDKDWLGTLVEDSVTSCH